MHSHYIGKIRKAAAVGKYQGQKSPFPDSPLGNVKHRQAGWLSVLKNYRVAALARLRKICSVNLMFLLILLLMLQYQPHYGFYELIRCSCAFSG